MPVESSVSVLCPDSLEMLIFSEDFGAGNCHLPFRKYCLVFEGNVYSSHDVTCLDSPFISVLNKCPTTKMIKLTFYIE